MAEILISDDDVDVLDLMAAILTEAGHTVAKSPSGSDTLKRLGITPDDASAELPDLIVLDIMMPKLDGYTIGNLIRSNPRTHAIPILVLSALQEMSRLFTATVQVEGFLRKPFTPAELLASVVKALDHHKPTG
jgi:CheY-like chemotaxis protein